jgi:hypothetical protein
LYVFCLLLRFVACASMKRNWGKFVLLSSFSSFCHPHPKHQSKKKRDRGQCL